jgi:phytoene dehydrogenase-like protein
MTTPQATGRPAKYDSIIIGAGHNGLVCAAYLAKSGQRVLVLEASTAPGGLAAKREFHPGFYTSVAHSISHFSEKVASDLDLENHGFENTAQPLPFIGLSSGEEHVVLDELSLSGPSAEDIAGYADYSRLMYRLADALKPFWLKTMPRIGVGDLKDMMTFAHLGLNIRRLGKNDMRELMRIAVLPARDLLDEYFDNEILKAMLSWDGLIGSRLAPRSPNSAVLMMLYRMAGESRGAHAIPSCGVEGIISALSASAKASGAEVRCAARVVRILIEGSSDGLVAKGVQLADGEQIEADRVISATDPQRTFLDLVGVEHLEIGFTNRIRRLRCDGYSRLIVAPTMDAIEFAYDDAKYGECSKEPVLEIVVPSLHDPSLAPEGKHVLSAHVMYVPRKLNGGWTDAARDQMRERAIDTIARYAPGIRQQIVHSELLSPEDLERKYHVIGGHWHHTDFAMDQMLMMRPTYDAAQYNTPIPGLYLCAAGCHPGGDITGAAGHNAAREILR